MKSNLAHEPLQPQGEVVRFPKKEREAMSGDKFDKGYVMSSRLYRYEVRPFLNDAAKNVYAELEDRINGFKDKVTDHVSYSQLQGGKLPGSKKMGTATVRRGLKELLDLGVISIVSENSRKGNEYRINEVSLVEHFRNENTTSKTEALPKLKRKHFHNESVSTSKTEDTIELLYRITNIELLVKSLRSQKPLETHFYCFQEEKKQNQIEAEKQEAEAKAKAEAERKEKSRKLSFDEVIKLTSEKFNSICDFNLWEQYVSNRSQTTKTKLTKNALNLIYADFKEWGVDGSNQSLKTSINGNYQGLFAPKQQTSGFSNQTQASTRWSEIQELIIQEEQGNDSYGF
ncbi:MULTISPECIES: hypothetical protein [unclassified Acinetobacter]|uniref:hypothetical protein n=1 Tax=unclassified Acinetobacter TaxID=196816 RepID=UPI0015D441EC|nr:MULTISPECIES: hypothetical protein [unclassified Acinetobacter]